MLELGRKESHLFSGIFVHIVIVGLLVFAYTQAVRQLNHSREIFLRLQEQLTVARDRMARRPPVSDLAALQTEVDQIKQAFTTPPGLEILGSRIEKLAQQEFGVQEAHLRKTDMPVDVLSFPIEGRPDLEVELYGLELTGVGTTRAAAGLLASMAAPDVRPRLALATLELSAAEARADQPAQWILRWLAPVVVSGPAPEEEAPPSGGTFPDKNLEEAAPWASALPTWGIREEPFSSPLRVPSALRVPAEKLASLRLTGILWDPAAPSCVINKRVLRAGDWLGSYQVVVITPEAVILQGLDEEIVLHLK